MTTALPSHQHGPHRTPGPTCAQLVAADGRTLPLVGAAIEADARGGVARVVLEQRFQNPYAEPLTVVYSLPLPSDGAVSGFSFRVGGLRVVGEVDRRAEARERYEQALVEGRSAAILEQDRSSLFTQEIGNIPPGEEIIAEIVVDQRLRWLDEGMWEWRFPTVVAPRYLGEAGRVRDADRVAQDVADRPLPARAAMRCSIRDAIPEGRRAESPSHAIESARMDDGARVELAAMSALDRDLVVRWPVASRGVGIALDAARPAEGSRAAGLAYGLLTVVPPSADARGKHVARDLIVLLDTSGSMAGEPLAQARRVASALIDTLGPDDQLELVEFSSAARRWRQGPVSATESARRDAIAWLGRLRASGSTEMRTGILEAMTSLRAWSQRQVVLVTDGQIGFESQVVAAICERLPASCRLHTVGVGSAVNRSLTTPAARAGRGVEVVIGLGEDPERAAARIVARTRSPLLVELEIAGPALAQHAPARLPDLFAGAPALIGVALRPEGGELVVRGRTAEGRWEQRIDVDRVRHGEGPQHVAALFAREAVEDLELRLAAGGARGNIDDDITQLGLDFQIATRLTSWIAVSHDETVDPTGAFRRERVPHELPHGMSAEGAGLRPAAFPAPGSAVTIGGPPGRRAFERAASAAMPAASMPASASRSKGAVPQGAPPPYPTGMPMSRSAPEQAGSTSDLPPALGAPAPAPAAPAPQTIRLEIAEERPGLFDRMKDALGIGKKKDESTEETRRAPIVVPTSNLPEGGRRIRGRIAARKGDEAIVALTVDTMIAWAPGDRVVVTLDDGSTVFADVATARSTRAGTLAAGSGARLVLTLPAGYEGRAIREILILSPGERLIIEIA